MIDEYSFEARTPVDDDNRTYPGTGNRRERRKEAAERRHARAVRPMQTERLTFSFDRGVHFSGDGYVPPAVKVSL